MLRSIQHEGQPSQQSPSLRFKGPDANRALKQLTHTFDPNDGPECRRTMTRYTFGNLCGLSLSQWSYINSPKPPRIGVGFRRQHSFLMILMQPAPMAVYCSPSTTCGSSKFPPSTFPASCVAAEVGCRNGAKEERQGAEHDWILMASAGFLQERVHIMVWKSRTSSVAVSPLSIQGPIQGQSCFPGIQASLDHHAMAMSELSQLSGCGSKACAKMAPWHMQTKAETCVTQLFHFEPHAISASKIDGTCCANRATQPSESWQGAECGTTLGRYRRTFARLSQKGRARWH